MGDRGKKGSDPEPSQGATDRGDGPIWLVGMMGCGKSTVGPLVAERLGIPFLDSDHEIERAAGRSIPEIFRDEGEARFRELEAEAIDRVAKRRAVVALGGGAMAQPGAPERLCATGLVVYLRAEPAVLAQRVGRAENRPLLTGLSRSQKVERLSQLLAVRSPSYERAQLMVETDSKRVGEVVEEILERAYAVRGGDRDA